MYIPPYFDERDPQLIQGVIDENNFGTLVSIIDERPYATHLPFVYDRDGARLRGHMARANPHWQALVENPRDVLVIIQGPHRYISPMWYANPGVPTWNYVAIHLYGEFQVLDDPEVHKEVLRELTDRHESGRTRPWLSDFSSPMVEGMIGATVAFDIVLQETQAKFKLNQNRSTTDRANVISELETDGSDNAVGVAKLMRTRR